MTGHPKSFTKGTSRRSILKGLGAAAIGISLTSTKRSAWAEEEKKLNFYNWDTYIGETTLDDFAEASGIDVNMSLFATNDELFAKLRAGNPGYDVIVPGSEFVERMIKADLLEPLDHAKIPNIKNISPEFMTDAPFDPGRKYSLPYTWLVIGIGYRKSKVKEVPNSWKWLFDSDAYKGRIAVMSDASELFRNCFKYLGHSLNDASPELLKQAEEMLTKQKPNIKAFHEDNGQDLLQSGEVDVVMEYNGDIAQIMKEDERRAASGERTQIHQLHLRTGNRQRNHRDDPVPVAECRRRGVDAGGLSRQQGDLPAGRRHGQVRVPELSRPRVLASSR
jgi:spermidine/putrescine transport system substrate-binding protein